MDKFVRIVVSLFITAALIGIAPAMAYTLNGKSWAYLSKPRAPVFIICDSGIDATAKGIVKAAAAIWANGDKFAFSFDDSQQSKTNGNRDKCDKISVIDFGPIKKGGVAVAAPCPPLPHPGRTCRPVTYAFPSLWLSMSEPAVCLRTSTICLPDWHTSSAIA